MAEGGFDGPEDVEKGKLAHREFRGIVGALTEVLEFAREIEDEPLVPEPQEPLWKK